MGRHGRGKQVRHPASFASSKLSVGDGVPRRRCVEGRPGRSTLIQGGRSLRVADVLVFDSEREAGKGGTSSRHLRFSEVEVVGWRAEAGGPPLVRAQASRTTAQGEDVEVAIARILI